jgi:hypothetical protein
MVKLSSTAEPEVRYGIAALDCKMVHGIVKQRSRHQLSMQYEWLAIFTMKPDFA